MNVHETSVPQFLRKQKKKKLKEEEKKTKVS